MEEFVAVGVGQHFGQAGAVAQGGAVFIGFNFFQVDLPDGGTGLVGGHYFVGKQPVAEEFAQCFASPASSNPHGTCGRAPRQHLLDVSNVFGAVGQFIGRAYVPEPEGAPVVHE